ncbi:hypothetical protein [Salinicoccus albus]|uniref:hypothetical protein n=1 Tax=Salinicoccus albus TaxID=418756 RepID=UPI000365F047|nr:hypothetical protein [Salinicoccus albus]
MIQLTLLFISMNQGINILNIVFAVMLIFAGAFVLRKFKKNWQVNTGIILILVGGLTLVFNVVMIVI